MSQYQENATVTRVEQFSDTNFRLTLSAPRIAVKSKPGQFIMVRAGISKDPLLRRPFSIHQASVDGTIQIYFKVVGRGTDIIAGAKLGDELSVLGPLGRGFRLTGSPVVIVGGGLGIAPLLFLVKDNCKFKKDCSNDRIILGAREKNEVEPLLTDFKQFGLPISIATDDGSLGHHGFVTELLETASLPENCTVFACGPEPMMAGVARFCKTNNIGCQVSVESVMACGMGACLGCSRPVKNGTYTHVCLNGPVHDRIGNLQ